MTEKPIKRWPLYLGGTLLGAIVLYGSLAALVQQGLTLLGALVMLLMIVAGGVALLYYLRE